jgi:hypothetical protein
MKHGRTTEAQRQHTMLLRPNLTHMLMLCPLVHVSRPGRIPPNPTRYIRMLYDGCGADAGETDDVELRDNLAAAAINKACTQLATTEDMDTQGESDGPRSCAVHRAVAMPCGNGDLTVVCKREHCADVFKTLMSLAALVEVLPTAPFAALAEEDVLATFTAAADGNAPASSKSDYVEWMKVDREEAASAVSTQLGMGLCLQYSWYPVQVR